MFLSIGQGGNQLAACVWNRAQQQQQASSTKQDADKRSRRANPYAASAGSASASALSSAPPLPVIPRCPWFALDGHAHAIIVDAEPKVVAQLQAMGKEMHAAQHSATGVGAADRRATGSALKAPKAAAAAASTSVTANAAATRTLFRPSNLMSEQYGRGNNWAMGYFGREGTEGTPGSLLSSTLDSVRLEFERLESGAGGDLVIFHSLSGGTGSGLGSRLAEELRAAYPKNFMLSVSIAPFGQGDTPLQHYNSLMCLHRIYDSMDAVVLASNADVSRALESLKAQRNAAGAGAASMASSTGSPAGNMAFAGINTYLSAAVADVLGPTRWLPSLKAQEDAERARIMNPAAAASSSAVSITPTTGSSLLASQPLYELLSHVSPLPSFKLLEIWSSAGLAGRDSLQSVGDARVAPTPSWKSCLESLQRFVPREAMATEGGDDDAIGRTLAYTVYARGDTAVDPVSACYSSLESRLAKLLPPAVDWNPYPLDLVPSSIPRMTMGRGSTESPRGLALCVNRSRTSLSLRPVVRKARTLLANRAYTHWYTRYGLEVDEMKQAFDAVEDIIEMYQTV